MTIRRCPRCKSSSVHRSRHRGLFEMVVLRLLLQRPYRCWSCYRRHYASIFSPGVTSAVERRPVSIPAGRPSFQGSLLLLILLVIPFLLAGSSPLLRTLDRLPLSGLRAGSQAVQSQLATRPTPAAPTQLALTSWEPALQPLEVLRPTGEVSANRMGPLAEASYPAPGSPAPQRQPLGALRTVGEVYLNEAKV